MAFVNFYNPDESTSDESYLSRFESRDEIVASLAKKNTCDVLVVGGGIHGASFARLAAFNGLRTVLLEKHDYGSATSSRSSKMAHGGLRYLEMYDFAQVFEGIKARDDLFLTAQHLVKPCDHFIPTKSGEPLFKFKLGLGLCLYDLFLKDRTRKHRFAARRELPTQLQQSLDPKISGGYFYTDGLMNDIRLVIETIIAARQEGARCLNYASVESIKSPEYGPQIVGWTDRRTNVQHELRAGIVVNCTGPWAPFLGRLSKSGSALVRYSQGTHLLFNKKWDGPALFLPLDGKARYYFVWPHPFGTLVGTTEREVTEIVDDPLPTQSEIEEILTRLEKDLPGSGLDRHSLHYSFAGIRTMAVKKSRGDVATLSRRHVWNFSNGVLTLLGGKFTTAGFTAHEGLRRVIKLAGLSKSITPLKGRKLPGAAAYESSVKEFRQLGSEKGLPSEVVEGAIHRLGGRVRYLLEKSESLNVIGEAVFEGELDLALKVEQAETLEDLLRRRFLLEYAPGHGVTAAEALVKVLKSRGIMGDVDAQFNHYRQRMSELAKVMQQHGRS